MLHVPHPRFTATAAALGLALLTGCAGEPAIQTGDDAEVIMGTLNRVDNTRVDMAYVDPEAAYGRFTRVLVMPLDVDHIEIIQPSSSSFSGVNRHNRDWELTDKDKQQLQDIFRESMEKAIGDNSDFELADAAAADVVVVEAMLRAIAPSAPRDDAMSRGTGRSRVFTEGAGGMSIAIALADGHSGEVIAIIKDTRNSDNSNWGINNSVSNLAEVRRNFNAWAGQLSNGLSVLRARAGSMAP